MELSKKLSDRSLNSPSFIQLKGLSRAAFRAPFVLFADTSKSRLPENELLPFFLNPYEIPLYLSLN